MERFEVDGRLVEIATTLARQLDAALQRATDAERHARDLQSTIDHLAARERERSDAIESYLVLVDRLGERLNALSKPAPSEDER